MWSVNSFLPQLHDGACLQFILHNSLHSWWVASPCPETPYHQFSLYFIVKSSCSKFSLCSHWICGRKQEDPRWKHWACPRPHCVRRLPALAGQSSRRLESLQLAAFCTNGSRHCHSSHNARVLQVFVGSFLARMLKELFRWLLSMGEGEKTVKIMKRIAKMNGKEVPIKRNQK